MTKYTIKVIATDADVTPKWLRQCLDQIVEVVSIEEETNE